MVGTAEQIGAKPVVTEDAISHHRRERERIRRQLQRDDGSCGMGIAF